MLSGTNQDSDVNTLGGIGVVGQRQTCSVDASISSLPAGAERTITTRSASASTTSITPIWRPAPPWTDTDFDLTPITYYPVQRRLQRNVGRGQDLRDRPQFQRQPGPARHSAATEEELRQQSATGPAGDFIYYRGDLSHTHDLPGGFRALRQGAGPGWQRPAVGQQRAIQRRRPRYGARAPTSPRCSGTTPCSASAEMRSPSLSSLLGKDVERVALLYAFNDGGILTINDPLPEQDPTKFKLLSVGAGTPHQAA